jgi:hypothetical protein
LAAARSNVVAGLLIASSPFVFGWVMETSTNSEMYFRKFRRGSCPLWCEMETMNLEREDVSAKEERKYLGGPEFFLI